MKLLKKKGKLILVLCIIAGILTGLLGPFIPYKEVSAATQEAVEAQRFRLDGTGPDRAMLLETNKSALEERIRLLDQAKERIIISTFDMREGQSTRDILSVLLKKSQDGVKIEIMVDGVSSFMHMKESALFLALSAQPGVELKLYNEVNLPEFYKLNGRMHDKYVIVDDMAYILGGRNMFDYFIGDYKTENRSHDREVLVYNTQGAGGKGSSLYQVEDVYKRQDRGFKGKSCKERG